LWFAYNDSRGRNFNPINISGASVSTDGGNTSPGLPRPMVKVPSTILWRSGSPVPQAVGTWVTVWLDGACGGQGLGGYKSTTPDDPNSWTHFCAFNEGSADRESGWLTTTLLLRFLDDCTFPGTTLISAKAL